MRLHAIVFLYLWREKSAKIFHASLIQKNIFFHGLGCVEMQKPGTVRLGMQPCFGCDASNRDIRGNARVSTLFVGFLSLCDHLFACALFSLLPPTV